MRAEMVQREEPTDISGQEEWFDRERERLHREMLSSVSHDLKTPLASIIGSLEIYERMRDKLSDEKKEALTSTALQEAYRLDNFITNILDMAKLEGGMVKIRRESVNVANLLQDCLLRLGNRIAARDVVITPPAAPVIVHTDQTMLYRAVGLLLDNALKHGGKHPLVYIDYGLDGPDLWLRIRDNGPGVPQERREDIFCKYTRFSKQDRQNAGTGLGLAICREIMRLLKGSVSVVNHDPSGGAIFTLRFPAA